MKGIDFTQLNKDYLEFRLKTGKFIHVSAPTISMFNDLSSAGNDINRQICAISKILSNNKEFIHVGEEELGEYGVDELIMITNSIGEFITYLANQKR